MWHQHSLLVTVHTDPAAETPPSWEAGWHRSLQHVATATIDVFPLTTGASRHVTGQLVLRRSPLAFLPPAAPVLRHYKLGETSLQVFAPGTAPQ